MKKYKPKFLIPMKEYKGIFYAKCPHCGSYNNEYIIKVDCKLLENNKTYMNERIMCFYCGKGFNVKNIEWKPGKNCWL